MRRMGRTIPGMALVLAAGLVPATAGAEPLTADRAVQMALERNSQVVGANAGVLEARSGLYGAYAGLLPRVSADLTRSQTVVRNQTGGRNIGGGLTSPISSDFEQHGTTPGLSGSWGLLNLSSLSAWSAARSGLKAAQQQRAATRNDVALSARRQFYEVVKAVRLAAVAANALQLAQDDERRVHALFEVGSVSRSDVLKAQVRTAQSELDSLTASQAVVAQRVALSGLVGVEESRMGEVDTLLTFEPHTYDEAALVAEAGRSRPDLMAAEAELAAARASLRGARFARLPYVTASASYQINPRSRSTSTILPPGIPPLINPGTSSTRSETDRLFSGQIALSWDVFDGLATDSRVASARARLLRAQDARDVLRRNLAAEVHAALLGYQAGLVQDRVARRALESAVENVKLTQQKYNVGSATILELIDAQVQLQRAQSDQVSALAAIRVAEATLDRVRGRSE
mgnify:CR=1 FL=1